MIMSYERPGDTVLYVEDIGNNEVVARVINMGGVPYTTIWKGGVEVASTPTEGEDRMIEWWLSEGRKGYADTEAAHD